MDIHGILKELRTEQAHLQKAISVLETLEGASVSSKTIQHSTQEAEVKRPAKGKRRTRKPMSEETKKRLSEMAKKRWAKQRKAKSA
ncbi:MAG: hypothetical protein ACP5EP_12670 [Acidobacteriaceae bacterium]